MVNTPRVRASTIVVPLIIVYLATLTWDYYWDGVTFALQIEKVANDGRGIQLLFHQNHLLYNALGYLFYKSANAVGLSVRALTLLQIVNAFVGGLAVGVFFRIAQRALSSPYLAAVCSVALAVSAAWWKISTDVDAYILTLLLILICADNLIGEKPRWFIAGLSLGGAMLFHEMAALFYPAAVTAVFSNRAIERKLKFAFGMSALAWGSVLSLYYLCAALLRGITRPLDLVKWAVSNPSDVVLSHNQTGGMLSYLRSNIDAVIGHNFGLLRRQGGWGELIIVAAALMAAIICAAIVARRVNAARVFKPSFELNQSQKQLIPMLVVWVGTYLLFLLFWGPLIYYRVFYMPAMALAFGLLLSNYHSAVRGKPSGAAAFAVAAFALFNLGFYIGPNMRAGANTVVAAARNASNVWNDRTVIYFADRKESDTAFEYFNQFTNWRKFSPAALVNLDGEIDRAGKEGGSIWLNKGAAESADPDWLSKHAGGREIEVTLPTGSARYVELSPRQ